MKIRKTAQQKNVTLNKNYYCVSDINRMLHNKEIFYFDSMYNECYNDLAHYDMKDKEFRIYTEDLVEIKVILDTDKHYATVAIGKNGCEYFITL